MRINRYQAFLWHLLGSASVGAIASALVFLLWYPWPLPAATGVTVIFLILLAVDVVIGPCITFIIFNPAKKELKWDLAIVLLLQVGAMLYGLHTMFVARPVYLVFNVDRFDLVYANDLSAEKLAKVSEPDFRSVPLMRPEIIGARRPDEAGERTDIMFNAAMGGDDVPQLPQYYVPYKTVQAQAQRLSQPLKELKPFNPDRVGAVTALIAKYASPKETVGFLPLRGKVADLTVIVRRDTGEVLEIKNLKPWPY